jgi:hypothetical protein
MVNSKIVATVAVSVLIGVAPGVVFSQTISTVPRAAIQAEIEPTLPDVQAKLAEVGHRLHQAELASVSRPLPESEYIEAQRETARGDYRQAMANLNQVEQQLDDAPNWRGR